MNADRWLQIDTIFKRALEREPKDRTPFLDQACSGDASLKKEVEALISSHKAADSFMESSASSTPRGSGLIAGRTFGSYEVKSLLGSGGMGEVYRAWDSELKRDVAIKVLPEAFSRELDRVSRFQREAEILAVLNHPNIAVIYNLAKFGDLRFLVMEIVEGETLQDRITRGPLAVDEALKLATQITEALAAAHEKGIIHRDLKPANIKVTREGTVKVLDFGLAKVLEDEGEFVSSAPTMMAASLPGMIVGTAAYMAPEQAKGKGTERTTDVWAFGCVLYEMLAGCAAFPGETVGEILEKVFKAEPEWQRLPIDTPQSIRRLLSRCLEKDDKHRLRDLRDARLELDDAQKDSSIEVDATGKQAPRTIPLRIAAAIIVLTILISAAAVWTLKPVTPVSRQSMVHLLATLPPGEELRGAAGPPVALSADGSMIAYASVRQGKASQLYLRTMDNPDAKVVPGSEGAFDPFFSLNGQWVGFFSQGKLKKVSVTGSSVETVCDAAAGMGGSWAADDTIYFVPANASGLWKVSASGGIPQPVTTVNRAKGEVSHRWPQVLPGGKAVLLTVWTGPGWDETQLEVVILRTGERRVVMRGTRIGRYSSGSGHLIYFRQGTDTLMAVPFDLDKLQIAGSPPITLAGRVRDTSEGGEFAVSDSGTLAYVPSTPQWYESRLVWVDRSGVIEPLPAPPAAYQEPVISPDGRQVATSIAGPAFGIWIYDFARTTLTSVTSGGSSQAPVWTPDGKRILYRATRTGSRNLFERAADGSGEEERLSRGDDLQTPGTFSADGTRLVFSDLDPTTGLDIWVLSLDSDPKTKPLLKTAYSEWNPHLSVDGRWLAYVSEESGREEVYVRPFPKLDGKWKLSTNGGTEPVWSPDGRELYYRNADKMMQVSIAAGSGFAASSPRLLFEGRYQFSGTIVSGYDISPDGRRFLMVQPADTVQPATQIHVVLNWSEELKNGVSTNKQ